MLKVIVFDLWNTLIPPTIDFPHLKSLLKKSNMQMSEFIPKYEEAVQIKKYNDFSSLRKDFFSKFSEKDNLLLEQALYEIYFNRFDKIHYFPDVEPILKKLKKQNYKLALLSNTESLNQSQIEEKLKLREYFDLLAYSFVVGSLKPSKKNFEFVLNHFKVNPNECLMVGDTPRSDILGAQSVGMHNCLILRETIIEKDDAIKPEFKIKSFKELPKVIQTINQKEPSQ